MGEYAKNFKVKYRSGILPRHRIERSLSILRMRGLATKVLDQVWKVDDTITLYKDARLKKNLAF